MRATKVYRRARRLFLLGGIVLSVVAVRVFLNSRTTPLTKAQASLATSRDHLNTALHATSKAGSIARRVAGPGSPLETTAQALGGTLIVKLQQDRDLAAFHVAAAATAQSASYCIRSFPDESRAQAALATLVLSGVTQTFIRPPTPGSILQAYQLMVAPEVAAKATEALQHTEVSRARTFAEASAAVVAVQALQAKGIPATLLLVKPSGIAITSDRLAALFILTEDLRRAQPILGGYVPTNAITL
jgi:hypothetical protein